MNYKHGFNRTPTHDAWRLMKTRCSCATNRAYPKYGGRGIEVCGRWQDFANFLTDMGPKPDGLTLERINNSGNYEPGNCRWATVAEQNKNRRISILVTRDGVTKTLKEWADDLGVQYGSAWRRYKRYGTIDLPT